MNLPGSRGQQGDYPLYGVDLTLSGAAQLVLGSSPSRSLLMLQNCSGTNDMRVEIGGPRATATLTAGKVTSIAVNNAGFNFTSPPLVRLVGGGPPLGQVGGPYLGLNQPNGPSPSAIAKARAVLVGGAVSSFIIDDPGAGYLIAPFVFLFNDLALDPYGCAIPTATTGLVIPTKSRLTFENTACPTGPIAVIGTNADVLACRWMD